MKKARSNTLIFAIFLLSTILLCTLIFLASNLYIDKNQTSYAFQNDISSNESDLCLYSDVGEYAFLKSEERIFANTFEFSFVVGYVAQSDMQNVNCISEGFEIKSKYCDLEASKIHFTVIALQSSVNHKIEIEVVLLSGVKLPLTIYAVVNNYGCFISQFSLDDANDFYFQYLNDNSYLNYEEIVARKSDMYRSGIEETYSSLGKRNAALSRSTTSGNYKISGTLYWEDDYGETHDARGIRVTAYAYTSSGLRELGYDYSGDDYSIDVSSDKLPFVNGICTISLRMMLNSFNGQTKVYSSSGNIYLYITEDLLLYENDYGISYSATFDMSTSFGQAVQIMQAVDAAQMLAHDQFLSKYVLVKYPIGSNCSYNSSTNTISITGNTAAQNALVESYAAWDVIAHEYGHAMEYLLGIIDSPGGDHYSSANMIDHYYNCDKETCNCAKTNSLSAAKSRGIGLAWSEGWATAYGTLSQAYAENRFPERYQNIYTFADDYYTSYNGLNYSVYYEDTESSRYKGEGNEAAVMTVLMEATFIPNLTIDYWWDLTTTGDPQTLSEFVQNFYEHEVFSDYIDDLGVILTKCKIAPSVVEADTETLTTDIPTFSWDAQGGSDYVPNNNFQLNFYNDNEELCFSVSTNNTSYTLSQTQWNNILGWSGELFYICVTGSQTNSPATGPYVGEIKEFNKPVYKTSVNNGKVTITGTYSPLVGSIIIPETIDGMPVVAIGAEAFKSNTELEGIGIPPSIESIGNRAFQFCYNLQTVLMKTTTVTRIEDYTFDTCAISMLWLPNTLTYIGEGAFIRGGVFEELPQTVTYIGAYAYSDAEIEMIMLPDTVTTIGDHAFRNIPNTTIYTEHDFKPNLWGDVWNSSNRPVIWGCEFSEDNSYIVSVNKESNFSDITIPKRDDFTFSGWSTTPNGETVYEDFADAPNGILYTCWTERACVADGTMITLADGSQKAVEDLTGDELLLVWNMFTGEFDSAPILFIDSEPAAEFEVIKLTFSDGTVVDVIDEHAFWNFDLNEYVFIREDAAKYIGDTFNRQTYNENGEMSYSAVQLTDVDIVTEYTTAWSPVTYGHLCYYVNGMLSMPGATEGLINIFEVDPDTMTIDSVQYAADIAEYGLYTYDEFVEEVFELPLVMFEAFNGQYMKVAIGKGLITVERLTELFARYGELF